MKTSKEPTAKGIRFKKIFITYFIIAIVAGIVSTVALGVTHKNEISLATSYWNTTRQISQGAADQKDTLTTFAKAHDKVVDVLILDENNNVTFSAKNSVLAETEALKLNYAEQPGIAYRGFRQYSTGSYLSDPDKPDVHYQALEIGFFGGGRDFSSGWFGYGDYNSSRLYEGGVKIYVVFDSTPIVVVDTSVKIVAAVFILLYLIFLVLIALYVYYDAKKSRRRAVAWGILALFANLWGLLFYLIYKRVRPSCGECHAVVTHGSIYCASCGVKLQASCPKCSGGVGKLDGYCRYCGEKLK
ncbi:zinc ribbon domain-containing protein [Lachnospiraceae bacterium ZAX-1]